MKNANQLAAQLTEEIRLSTGTVDDLQAHMTWDSIDNIDLDHFSYDACNRLPSVELDTSDADIEGLTFGKHDGSLVIRDNEMENIIAMFLKGVEDPSEVLTDAQLSAVSRAIMNVLEDVVLLQVNPITHRIQNLESDEVRRLVCTDLTANQ